MSSRGLYGWIHFYNNVGGNITAYSYFHNNRETSAKCCFISGYIILTQIVYE